MCPRDSGEANSMAVDLSVSGSETPLVENNALYWPMLHLERFIVRPRFVDAGSRLKKFSSRCSAAETITRWTTSTCSSLAARQTADSLQVSYPDIQGTS